MKRVMGIDASLTSTGVVIVDFKNGKREVIYSQAIKSFLKGIDRLVYIRDVIEGLLKRFEPDEVVLEGYSYGAKFNREVLAELGGIIKTLLWSEDFLFKIIAPTTLKKFITGYGRAKKKEIKKVIEEKYNVKFKTIDEYDAFALCFFAGDK